MHLRMTGALLFDPTPSRSTRGCDSSSTAAIACSTSTRGGSGPANSCTARPPATSTSPRGSASSRSRRSSPRSICAALARGRTRADQVVRARSATDRGRREHLRRRGAVPRRDPSAAASRAADAARSSSGCDRRSRRRCSRDRGEGRLDRRLPPHRRRPRLLPGPLPGPPTRRRAVPHLWAADPQARRRRPRDLRLRALPAASPTAAPPRRGGDQGLSERRRGRDRRGCVLRECRSRPGRGRQPGSTSTVTRASRAAFLDLPAPLSRRGRA